jgi:hypothetical protein
VNTLCTGQIIALRGRTTPRRVFGANCCHAQRGKHPASARADDGGWGSTVSPSFLTARNFFTAAAPPCPPLGVFRLPVAGDLFCALPPLAWFVDDHHGAGAHSLHLLLRRTPYTGSSGAGAGRCRGPALVTLAPLLAGDLALLTLAPTVV